SRHHRAYLPRHRHSRWLPHPGASYPRTCRPVSGPAGGGLILRHDAGRDASPVADLDARALRPRPDVAAAPAARRAARRPAPPSRFRPAGVDEEGCELPAERPGVLPAQVDLVDHAVQPEPHRLVGRAPVKIVFQHDGYLSRHPGLLTAMGYQHGTDRHGRAPADRGWWWAGSGRGYSGTAASSAGWRRNASAAGIRLASTAMARQASAMPASGSHGMTTRTDGARPSRPCRRPVTVAAVTAAASSAPMPLTRHASTPISRSTWPGVAPDRRSVASSRIRSPVAITSVLAMAIAV